MIVTKSSFYSVHSVHLTKQSIAYYLLDTKYAPIYIQLSSTNINAMLNFNQQLFGV